MEREKRRVFDELLEADEESDGCFSERDMTDKIELCEISARVSSLRSK